MMVFWWFPIVDTFRTLDWQKIQQDIEFSGILNIMGDVKTVIQNHDEFLLIPVLNRQSISR